MLSDTPSLEGCEAKFGRGKAHAKRLRKEIVEALDGYAYPVRIEREDDARQYIFYVKEIPAASPDWGLGFGDAVHNFRATLDHLVVQLAILGQGRALTEDELRASEFPVLTDPGSWQKVSGPRAVGLLRSGDRERIRDLQPFNATDRSIWGRQALMGGGARIPRLIEALHRADIADKHRSVHPSWYAVKSLDAPSLGAGPMTAETSGQRLEPDAELGRWSFPNGLPDLPADLDISRYFPLGIEFAEGTYGYLMVTFLDEVEGMIEGLIELFRPALTNGDPTPQVTSIPL